MPSLLFFNSTAAVKRPARSDTAHTLHHNVGWDAVSGMDSIPLAFQRRGQRPFATDVGIVYDESADGWVNPDDLPTGGVVLTGDRLTVGSDDWDVVSAELVNHGGVDRFYRLSMRKTIKAA